MAEEPVAYTPLLFWVRVKRGWRTILRQIVVGWRALYREAEHPPLNASR